MNNSQVAHLWAQRKKQSGKGSNFYFEGDTIYSYGAHYPAARFHDNTAGETCVLINSRNYSSTTVKHISLIKRALNLRDYVFVARVPIVHASTSIDHETNIEYLLTQINALRVSLVGARENTKYLLERFDETRKTAEQYCLFFRVGPMSIGDLSPAEYAVYMARIEAITKKTKEKEDARIKKQRERFEQWPFDLSIKGYFNSDDIKLRINGDNIETSKGAFVTIDEAKTAIKLWARKNLVKGEPIGNYTVNDVNDDQVVIGCHTISTQEIERISVLIHLREKDKKANG